MDGADVRTELEKHHRESYGWSLACCHRNPSDAENVLQTAYLKVLDGKARFDGKSTFKTWFFAVIRRTAIDHRRREVLGRLRLVKHEQSQVRSTGSFEEAVFRSEVQSLFREALDQLPRRQQEVLQLVFYHDVSVAEAARIMGVGLGSARTHYERGKKQLRSAMTKLGVYDETGIGRRRDPATIP